MKIHAINTNSQSNHTTNFKAKPVGLAHDILQKALVDIYDGKKSKTLTSFDERNAEINLGRIFRFGKSYGLKFDVTEDVTKGQYLFHFTNEFLPQGIRDICKISKYTKPLKMIDELKQKINSSPLARHINSNSSQMKAAQFFETFFK